MKRLLGLLLLFGPYLANLDVQAKDIASCVTSPSNVIETEWWPSAQLAQGGDESGEILFSGVITNENGDANSAFAQDHLTNGGRCMLRLGQNQKTLAVHGLTYGKFQIVIDGEFTVKTWHGLQAWLSDPGQLVKITPKTGASIYVTPSKESFLRWIFPNHPLHGYDHEIVLTLRNGQIVRYDVLMIGGPEHSKATLLRGDKEVTFGVHPVQQNLKQTPIAFPTAAIIYSCVPDLIS